MPGLQCDARTWPSRAEAISARRAGIIGTAPLYATVRPSKLFRQITRRPFPFRRNHASPFALHVFALAGPAIALAAGTAVAETVNVQLRGFEEVPVNTTDATGSLRLFINDRAGRSSTSSPTKTCTGTVTQAHIHVGQAGVNGGISLWLCQTSINVAPPAVAAVTPTCPQAGTVTGLLSAASVVGPAGQLVGAGRARRSDRAPYGRVGIRQRAQQRADRAGRSAASCTDLRIRVRPDAWRCPARTAGGGRVQSARSRMTLDTRLLRAIRTAVVRAVGFQPVADDRALAVRASRGQHVDRAFEAVERVARVAHLHDEGLVVVVPAVVASCHHRLPK